MDKYFCEECQAEHDEESPFYLDHFKEGRPTKKGRIASWLDQAVDKFLEDNEGR